MSAQPKLFSESEYLYMERASSIKHEFYQGRIYAMTGASKNHNLIVANTLASLHGQLRRSSCQVYASDMRVAIPSSSLYTYPDLVIVCGQTLFRDDQQDTLINPLVFIEILSPSTERYDRGMKFQHYSMLESVQDYLLIAQDQQRIEHFTRQGSGQWLLHVVTSAEHVITIDSIKSRLNLDDIYEKVDISTNDKGVTREAP